MPWRYSGAINFVPSGHGSKYMWSAIAQFFSFSEDSSLSDYTFHKLKSWLADFLKYSEHEATWFSWADVGEGWQTVDFSEAKGLGLYYAEMRIEDGRGVTVATKKIHLRFRRRGETISEQLTSGLRQLWRSVSRR